MKLIKMADDENIRKIADLVAGSLIEASEIARESIINDLCLPQDASDELISVAVGMDASRFAQEQELKFREYDRALGTDLASSIGIMYRQLPIITTGRNQLGEGQRGRNAINIFMEEYERYCKEAMRIKEPEIKEIILRLPRLSGFFVLRFCSLANKFARTDLPTRLPDPILEERVQNVLNLVACYGKDSKLVDGDSLRYGVVAGIISDSQIYNAQQQYESRERSEN